MAKLLGELLKKAGIITEEQLEKSLSKQKETHEQLGSILISDGVITEDQLLSFLSKQFDVPTIDLSSYEINPYVKDLIPGDIARKYSVIPVDKFGNIITLAMSDPTHMDAIQDLKFLTNCEIEKVLASETQIKEAISRAYGEEDDLTEVLDDLTETGVEIVEEEDDVDLTKLEAGAEEAPIIKFVNQIISAAILIGASDIHIEPYEKVYRVRYRLDGVLFEKLKPPLKLKDLITTRLKIMSNLDISEKRKPQDGRIKMKVRNKEVDLRVSVLPCIHGEKIVMRILDKSNLALDLTKLGFEEKSYEDFKKAIKTPWGMILITGPTGSGKTTTLYSALSTLNKTTENIMTAEDPVEYNLKGINQVQINPAVDLTFAAALKAFLRQDPDIIMVGEIRDLLTAETAIQAALTGHLVLSTLHTNDAPASISRLENMGIEPYLVAASVILVGAQRLVRKVCSECKEEIKIPDTELKKLGISPSEAEEATFFQGKGCSVCNNTGYKQRIAIYEMLPITDTIKEAIIKNVSTIELKRTAKAEGMLTLRDSALTKLKRGLTTLAEVYRVTGLEEI